MRPSRTPAHYDGDGKSDILWRHDKGDVFIWEMNGLAIENQGAVQTVGTDWHTA